VHRHKPELNMSGAEHVYTRPREHSAGAIPAAVASYLDGEDLLAKTQALRLSTVDADGWPHAALLSAGDMLALPGGRIRFAVFPRSGIAANLERDGRITVSLSVDGGMCELRMRARKLQQVAPEVPLACFEAEVVRVREHVAPYADVTTGVTFVLHDPRTVLSRWQRQIAALRAAA
jgi:Pyridoxamine 5'-phosphate oxidase